MTAVQLKDIAKGIEHEAVQGYTQLNKDHLIKAICTALKIEMHEHHDVKGLDKAAIKLKIKEFKKERDQAIATHDAKQIAAIRHQIKEFKKKLRKAMV